MKYQAILFDLDGTLLPMDMQVFMKSYFKELAATLQPMGISAERLIPAVWDGTKAMIQNDGSRANVEVFWDRFCALTGERRSQFEQACNGFYTREFHRCRISTGDNQLAREAIRRAREQAEFVILATNPLFPMDGQLTRLSWIGLKAEDFDLITAYEGECYCKPNPLYYQHICERFGVMPRQCLMIGNDENEDMFAATRAGLQGYLVTDCVLKSEAHPWRGPQGTFAQMVDMLAGI